VQRPQPPNPGHLEGGKAMVKDGVLKKKKKARSGKKNPASDVTSACRNRFGKKFSPTNKKKDPKNKKWEKRGRKKRQRGRGEP